MTGCILSGIMCARPDADGAVHLADEGSQACFLGAQRLAGTLRAVVELVDELAGGGYVERDVRPGQRAATYAYDVATRRRHLVFEPAAADPVANVLTAGPINGRSGAPRVAGSGERSLPIRVDPTDLTMPARVFRLAGRPPAEPPREPCRFCREHHVADLHPPTPAPEPIDRYADQIGHLSVATELEFWARDWADTRRESVPPPTVPLLARWLHDRLDWACQTHPALDEFARKLRDLRGSLTAATGRLEPFPTPVDRPCPACGWWALSKAPGEDLIRCGHCDRALSDDEYRDHLEAVIKTNWTRPADGLPPLQVLVWARDAVKGVTPAFYSPPSGWMEYWGDELTDVAYWAPLSAPADPGPRKEESA